MPKGRGILSHCRGDAGQRGYSLSKENTPFGTPREKRGENPSTPDIAGLELEELHALRNVSAVYMASPSKACVLRRRHHM